MRRSVAANDNRKPPDPNAPLPFEPKRVWPTPENIWTVSQFWGIANKLANLELTAMHGAGHALTTAAKNGVIDPVIVADSVLRMALHSINLQIPPAGNA